MIPLCGYILQGGKKCGQAAIKGEVYCRHHLFVRQAIADAAPQGGGGRHGERAPLPFVFPEDRAAVQINYFLVLQALNAGKLDLKTASMMIRLLKACDANLKKGSLNEGAETGETDSELDIEPVMRPATERTSAPGEDTSPEAASEDGISVQASGEIRHTNRTLSHAEILKQRFKGKRGRRNRRGRR